MRNSGKAIELELFVAGHVVEKFTINHLICTNAGCMSKGGFNSSYLHASYPNDLLQNILLGRAIYSAKNRVKSADGFTQHIVTKDVDIKYKVDAKSIFFKDRKNKIIFKIKDIK